MSRLAPVALALALTGAALAAACTSSSGDGPAPLCAPPKGCAAPSEPAKELTAPAVSFARDVLPIFTGSCALSASCHHARAGGGGPTPLYLGALSSEPPDPAGVHAAVVNKASAELPSLPYVTPGDPAKSYLMHKMDGDMCQFASQCKPDLAASCGVVMPLGGCALDGASRDRVRRWIAQGAQNN